MPTTSASELNPDDAVERFRRDAAALGIAPTAAAPLALAVSGGPDSMAMLWLARRAFAGSVIAATVDHGLRAESAAEAAMVAGWCAGRGIPHSTLIVEHSVAGASVQARARAARYALLRDWALAASACAIATAHHADDQAETFLMRAARGSGIAGLSGIRVRRELLSGFDRSVPVVRPLLSWRHAELCAVVDTQDVPFVDDPSNANTAFDRVRFRQILDRNPELDVRAIAASATYAAEIEQTLVEIADAEWLRRRLWDQPPVTIEMAGLPKELRRRIARYAISSVRNDEEIDQPEWSEAVNIEPLLDALDAGKAATQAGVLIRPRGTMWRFTKAPPRRSH